MYKKNLLKHSAFLVLLPLCFSGCLSLLGSSVDFGSFQDDPVYRDKLAGIWVLDTSESGNYDTLEFKNDGTCVVVWYKNNRVNQTWATRYKVSSFQLVFSFEQSNDVRRANYVIIDNNTLSLTNWSNGSRNETYHRSDVGQSEIDRNDIESVLKRATNTVISTLQKEAIIAIINISSNDSEVSEFIAGELEYILVSNGFNVVDRSQLDKIRQEQHFQLSGDVDDTSSVSIGKFAGANIVMTGAITGSGNTRRFRLRALDTQTAMVVGSASEALLDRSSSQQTSTVNPVEDAARTVQVNTGSRQTTTITSSTGLNRIYVAGVYDNKGYSPNTTCYWVDGVIMELPNPSEDGTSESTSDIAVSGGKVYVAGYYNSGTIFNKESIDKACYWVDGIRTDLPVPSQARGTTSGIAVSDGKVYVAGNSGNTACYWVDRVRTDLPVPSGATTSGIAVSGGKVYVAGNVSTSGGPLNPRVDTACYWADGVRTNIPVPSGATGGGTSGITVSGGKVYVVGYYSRNYRRTPCYWIDGVMTELPVPSGVTGETSDIAVSGGKVYVAGNSGDTPCYWIDGVRTDLPVPNLATKGNVSGITVSGGKVYVVGNVGNNDNSTACYWVDGVRTDLTIPPTTKFIASAIAVER